MENQFAPMDMENLISPVKLEQPLKPDNEDLEKLEPVDINFNFADSRFGIIEFQYHNNDLVAGVKRFTIATQTQNATIAFSKRWVSDIEYCLRSMKISELYTVKNQMYFRLKTLLNISVVPIPSLHLKRKCPTCRRCSCSVFKVKNRLYNLFKIRFTIKCKSIL